MGHSQAPAMELHIWLKHSDVILSDFCETFDLFPCDNLAKKAG